MVVLGIRSMNALFAVCRVPNQWLKAAENLAPNVDRGEVESLARLSCADFLAGFRRKVARAKVQCERGCDAALRKPREN